MATRWWQNEQPVEENAREQTLDDLFVFGYACKLFRDDERAKFIDDEKHLIPWMGNDSLLIDRYDGRGHLYDLRNYDVVNVNTEQIFLTDEQRQVELACEEERYLELRVDLAEQATYEEEEWKRYYEAVNNDGTYNAVRFSYDYNEQQRELEPSDEIAQEEAPFEVPEELKLPPGINVPPTEKVNAIIAKTATFLAEHGVQMEIMIKMKQKDNPQFEFLEHDNELCAYFRHMVQMIKSGKYKPKVEATDLNSELERQNSSYEEEEEDSHYLHPSLFAKRSDSPAPKPVPKPVVSVYDTSYGELIKSMSKSIAKEIAPLQPPPLPPRVQIEQQETISAQADTKVISHPPIIKQAITDQHVSHDVAEPQEKPGSDSDNVPQGPQIIPPPPELQPIVDRMAQYVAKNGADFETVVKSKNDPRFQFIQSWHHHYPYYEYKKNIFIKEKAKAEAKHKQIAQKGISFSLKSKPKDQENMTLDKRKAFADHSSDDDEEGNSTDEPQGHRVDRDGSGVSTPDTQPEDSSELHSNKSQLPVAISDDLVKKQAEEKVKDRLASAARDKLAQTTKDQQIKADRKRKAAMFVNLLKSSCPSTDTPSENGKSSNDIVEVKATINGSLQDPITVDADPDVMIVDPPQSFSNAQAFVAKALVPVKKQSASVPVIGKRPKSAPTSGSSSPTNSKQVIEYSHGLRAPKRAISPPSAYKLQRRSRSRTPKSSSSSSSYKLAPNSRQLTKRWSRSPTYKTSKPLSSSSSTKHKSDAKSHSKSSSSKSSSLTSKSTAKHSRRSQSRSKESRSKEQNRKRHRTKSRSKSPNKKSSKSSSSKTSSSSKSRDRDKKSHSSSSKHKLFKPIPELPKSKSKSKTESSKSKHSNGDDKPVKTDKHRTEKSSKRLINGDDSERVYSDDEHIKDVHVIDDDDDKGSDTNTRAPDANKEHSELKKKPGRLRSVLKQSRRDVLREAQSSTKLFVDELT